MSEGRSSFWISGSSDTAFTTSSSVSRPKAFMYMGKGILTGIAEMRGVHHAVSTQLHSKRASVAYACGDGLS